jgi:hypothetical protein
VSPTDRELVAVPDAHATVDPHYIRYRLGMRNKKPGAAFTLGETGPNGQTFPWVYVQGEGATYEIDLLDGELTVTTKPNDQIQAVVYKINVDEMTGQEIAEGKPVRIVFAYDEPMVDETTPIEKWVATTGPRYGKELHDRLGRQEDLLADQQYEIEEAKKLERFGNASRAPRTAEPLHGRRATEVEVESGDIVVDATQAGLIDLTTQMTPEPVAEPAVVNAANDEIDLDAEEPEAVQIPDPQSGAIYVGRRWKRGQRTTLRSLKNASYRVAVLVLHSGQSATIVLQHPKGLPAIQLTTKNGIVRQYLSEQAWDESLEPGKNVALPVSEPMDGDRPIPRGYIPLSNIEEVAATGPQAENKLDYPVCKALGHFRNREHEILHGRPLSRNLVA